MFKVENRKRTTRGEICSKLTIKIPERCHWHHSGIFLVNFEHISLCFSVSIVRLKQVNGGWRRNHTKQCKLFTSVNRSRLIKNSRRKSEHLWDLLHIYTNEKTFADVFIDNFIFSFCIFFSHCFSLLSACLSFKPF